ncbi:flagellar basal body L-ring protein FlgH [Albimonas sp. CAU 1670]|uniref:flagellar basal body L-ring protein FlgH n=1 Tax=Albimonas sp. CAU 1670 TaxID=3032599 RepID=UPI0023DB9A3C|nr:flagellar basal body L-ring protein FlgH [Albimonas sp. CAU 1670]MDF2231232.1 flagellar basal body L-ring protein FlgH [Albimonas sp. CAU 1670]
MTLFPSRLPALVLALGALLLLTACSDRLKNVGKEPEFTAPGAAVRPPPPVTPQRRAIATPPERTPPPNYAVASLWRSGPDSLFGDRRAQSVGDILTVVIEIDDSANISNQSERNRSASEDVSVSALVGLPSLVDNAFGVSTDPAAGIGSSSSSSGDGKVTRNEQITLRIAVTVVDQLPNGHLVVAGNQEVRVNYELRDLQVAGIVRPEDISRRNEITYDKMAEARIAYGGRGQIYDVQQPRYGQQVLDVVMPF